jgi:hypothetical protein
LVCNPIGRTGRGRHGSEKTLSNKKDARAKDHGGGVVTRPLGENARQNGRDDKAEDERDGVDTRLDGFNTLCSLDYTMLAA